MISIPGNKSFAVVAVICCMAFGMVLSAMLSQRKNKIQFYEKKIERTVSAIEERNMKEAGAADEVF